MSLAVARPLSELTEKKWSDQLFSGAKKNTGLAVQLGWRLNYHVHRADRSPAGYPDWTLVRERIIFAELKRQPPVSKRDPSRELAASSIHRLSDYQREWLDGLALAGGEAYVWVPSDIDEIATILMKRWSLVIGLGGPTDRRLSLRPRLLEDPWTPGSMWIPGKGRADGRQV